MHHGGPMLTKWHSRSGKKRVLPAALRKHRANAKTRGKPELVKSQSLWKASARALCIGQVGYSAL